MSLSLPPSPKSLSSPKSARSHISSLSSSSIPPPSITPNFFRQPTDDRFLIKWLRENHLMHIYDKISKSRISIIKLSECDEKTIRNTSKTQLKLSGRDLCTFERSLIKYNNIQCLLKRNTEVSSCIDSLEFTKNELNIKRKGDILYIKEKFKKLIKELKTRENDLIEEIKKSTQNKTNILNEQILSMKEYKHKLEAQNKILSKKKIKKKEVTEQNRKSKRLLNKTIAYDKKKFAKINKMSVEIANYDEMMKRIQNTGVIIDEFNEKRKKHNQIQDTIDETMDCLCGTPLVLTNVDVAYKNKDIDVVFCNFCNNKCLLPYNGDIYHCPKGDVDLHPGGFDLCQFCGTQCLEARKADKRRKREEKLRNMEIMSRSTINKYRYNNNKHRYSRSLSAVGSNEWGSNDFDYNGFLYDKQLNQLCGMGYDHKLCAKLLIKYKGNMIEVMAELLT